MVSFPGPVSGVSSREEVGYLKRYEVVYISFDDLSTDEFELQLERYKTIITGMEGTVIKVDIWGKRRLAYPIQKRRDGVYVLIDFAGDGEIVPELERNFRIDDKILRFISVKTADKVDPEELEREIAKAGEAEQAKEASVAAEAVQEAQAEEAATEPEAGQTEEAAAEPEVAQAEDAATESSQKAVTEPVEEAFETKEN